MGEIKNPAGRRTMLAGTGAVGALAAAAALLPGARQSPVKLAEAKPLPDTAAGYRLTEHVKQYYRTTRI